MAELTGDRPTAFKLEVQFTSMGADVPSYYVNYVSVSHTPYDFTLTATKIPSPLSDEQIEALKNGKAIQLEPLLQIVLPPAIMDGLIKALNDQQQQYAREQLLNRGATNDKQQ